VSRDELPPTGIEAARGLINGGIWLDAARSKACWAYVLADGIGMQGINDPSGRNVAPSPKTSRARARSRMRGFCDIRAVNHAVQPEPAEPLAPPVESGSKTGRLGILDEADRAARFEYRPFDLVEPLDLLCARFLHDVVEVEPFASHVLLDRFAILDDD
jgi:hypothetical protein